MSRCGSFCFVFLNASLVLPPFLSRKHSSKKGKIGGQGRETGSHKGQMWSDGCCSYRQMCSQTAQAECSTSHSFVFSLETGNSLIWKAANSFALAHTQV